MFSADCFGMGQRIAFAAIMIMTRRRKDCAPRRLLRYSPHPLGLAAKVMNVM
jgi:hypothetical protein